MKVKELIKKLQQLDQDKEIYYLGTDEYDYLTAFEIENIRKIEECIEQWEDYFIDDKVPDKKSYIIE